MNKTKSYFMCGAGWGSAIRIGGGTKEEERSDETFDSRLRGNREDKKSLFHSHAEPRRRWHHADLRTQKVLPQYRPRQAELGCSAFTTVTTPSILLHITGRSDTITGQQSIFPKLLFSSLRLRQGGRPSSLPMVHYPAWINEWSQVRPPFISSPKADDETSILWWQLLWFPQAFMSPQRLPLFFAFRVKQTNKQIPRQVAP